MANHGDTDFRQIAPRLGGIREAFEELCCQLARRTIPEDAPFRRLHGAGGDGGVECFSDAPSGGRVGWQAKYLFDIGPLLAQATQSLTQALDIHPTLTRYILCFPFDLTGPTGRPGRSGQEKFDKWRQEQEQSAVGKEHHLTIEPWPASKLRSLLLQYDPSGGVREFFFNEMVLTTEWFTEHLDLAKKTAGPRYTPELNIETDLWKWFVAFGHAAAWSGEFRAKVHACRERHEHLVYALERSKADPALPAWPEELREDAEALVADMGVLWDDCDCLATGDDLEEYKRCVSRLDGLLSRLANLESQLAIDVEAQHGHGKADSPGFRQFMAEYMCSFPAANLDYAREAIAAIKDLHEWLCSPASSLVCVPMFVLSGAAGSGKTHGVCDAAVRRLSEGFLTCVTFGHQFRGEPDPWTRLLEALGLRITLGMNGLLDALNAAGEASGSPLILCIDAINETRPLRYWRDRLSAVSQAIARRPYLRLCVTCRTSFVPYCLPDGHEFPIVEHGGFAGIEREACQSFFRYYKLDPPIRPILEPELSNPLYLRLLCEALRSRGLRRLPSGWHGIAQTIRTFLDEKERQFSAEYETAVGANIVSGSLMAISRAIAESGNSSLPWSEALRVISEAKPQARTLPVLEWLVHADLLVEDAPVTHNGFGDESVLRPAFERLGDFLVAAGFLEGCSRSGLNLACQPGGVLYTLLKDSDTVEQNSGILSALSIILPEQNRGLEFPNLIDSEPTRALLVRIAVRSFPSRDPNSFTAESEHLIREALGLQGFSYDAMDAVLAISWQPSAIDAIWLDWLLRELPLAKRDAFWCHYLHDRFEARGAVRRLIDAAFELPLGNLEPDIAERWAVVLLWLTAAADRRVKDKATRAVVALLTAHPRVIPSILQRLIGSDDDEVRERTLLSCYGAAITSRDASIVRIIIDALQDTYRRDPEAFDNALIRDDIRCIAELARELNVLPEGRDTELSMQPIASEWPLTLPSDDEIKAWHDLPKLVLSCTDDDFFIYSMGCLRLWEHAMSKGDMGKWILQRVARDFGYEGSGCERYDSFMLGTRGGGRGKPKWAERIGKKYQWIAMYQLASRLHDHIVPKWSSWEPKPLQTPLILLEERKLDPTLSPHIIKAECDTGTWWVNSPVGLASTDSRSDEEWAADPNDLLPMEKFISVVTHDQQSWRLLVSYPAWRQRDIHMDEDKPYRYVWMHIESYLVERQNLETAYSCLCRRNFFGRWMPESASWLYGFAGEYPWATPFNTEPEEWHGRGGHGRDLPVVYEPSWNELAVEWEYDASIPRNFHMHIPARTFFSPHDLWWNGKDGYRFLNGRTVFRDPSVTEIGPGSLIVDSDDLLKRLADLGMRLVWTLLGEKLIVGGPHDKQTHRRTFSQVGYLCNDGSVRTSERVFFEDYDQDTGPAAVKRKRGKKGI